MQCSTPPQDGVRHGHGLVIKEDGKGSVQKQTYMSIYVWVRSGALAGGGGVKYSRILRNIRNLAFSEMRGTVVPWVAGEGLNIVEFFEIVENSHFSKWKERWCPGC